jgi:SMC interacting uncharacterized protein involved in chromosome segregation
MDFTNLTNEELSRVGESYIATPLERVLMDRLDALLDVYPEIEELEARIAELEEENRELKSDLADCEAEIDNN